MPSKKERLAELERKVAELETRLSGYWLLDKNSPNVVTFPGINECAPVTNWNRCPNCGASVQGIHACWAVNPNIMPTNFGILKTPIIT